MKIPFRLDTYITFGYCYCLVLHHIELIANGQIYRVAEWLSFLHLVYHTTSDSVPITQHNPIPGTKHFHNQQKQHTTDSNIFSVNFLVAALDSGIPSTPRRNSESNWSGIRHLESQNPLLRSLEIFHSLFQLLC